MSSKITALTALTSVQTDDVLPVVDIHDTTMAPSGTTKQITVANLQAALAPLASPAFTGTPSAPTKPALTNSTALATTAYADAAVSTETTRATTAEALKAPLASPALTGTPTAPTATALTSTTQLATTAYADSAVAVEKSRAQTAEGLTLPKTGGTMSGAIAMGSSKVTGLANGTAAADAAAFGQLAVPTGSAPAGAIAQTIPLWLPNTGAVALASGVLQLHAITLPAGIPVSNIAFMIGNTGGLTLTHGWYALVNPALLQVAHTADQTSGSLAGGSEVTKALVTPFTPASTAQYFVGICVVAGTQPSLSGYGTVQAGGLFSVHPVNGPSSTGLTGPGTDGVTSYAAITAAADPAYAWVS